MQGALIHHTDLSVLLQPGFPTTDEKIGVQLLKEMVSKISHIMLSKWLRPSASLALQLDSSAAVEKE